MRAAGTHGFEVLANEEVASGVWRMRCATELASSLEPGQFVNVAVPGDGAHILRIPLSFSVADAGSGVLELVYATVGEGTVRLSHMRPRDTSTMVGPLGKGWRLPAADGRALLVAGGIGLPPVYAAARMLAQAQVGFDVVVGARSAGLLVGYLIDDLRGLAPAEGCDCARRVLVCTDDGTAGMAGFTTEAMARLMEERAYGQVYACGPNPMLAGVAARAREARVACQVSLERMMGCGFGACSCCNVALVQGGYALCCTDGPVFDAEEVAW